MRHTVRHTVCREILRGNANVPRRFKQNVRKKEQRRRTRLLRYVRKAEAPNFAHNPDEEIALYHMLLLERCNDDDMWLCDDDMWLCDDDIWSSDDD